MFVSYDNRFIEVKSPYTRQQTRDMDVSGRNKKIDVDDVQPDMTLAEPILDARGEVLLPSGAALTESVLAGLQRRGIDQVIVVDNTITDEQLAAERERVKQRLDRLFRKCCASGEGPTLFRYVQAYRTGEAS